MLPKIEMIRVQNIQELNDKRDIEISNISNNITVSEIYDLKRKKPQFFISDIKRI